VIGRLGLVAVVAIAVGSLVTAGLLKKNLQSLPRYQVDPHTISGEFPGDSWIDDQFVNSLEEYGFVGLERRSVFYPDLLDDYGRAVAANPWVRRVVRSERQHPSQVSLVIELREPSAGVRHEGGMLLVDRDGVRLPGEHDELPAGLTSLLIINGVSTPPPAGGELWRTDAIPMAFATHDLLVAAGVPDRLGIHEISVAYDPLFADTMVTLVAGVDRTRIEWGKSPLNRDSVEVSDDHKLANLEKLLDFNPGLVGLYEVSVAGSVPSYRTLRARGEEITRK